MLGSLRKFIACVIAATAVCCGVACDSTEQDTAEPSHWDTVYGCPDGSVHYRWLVGNLSPSFREGPDIGSTYTITNQDGHVEDKCVSAEEITRIVSDALPELHAEIDETNSSIDRVSASVLAIVEDVRAISDPKQRLVETLKLSCDPPRSAWFEHGRSYGATPFVDASPATIRELVDRYHRGPHDDRWPPRKEGRKVPDWPYGGYRHLPGPIDTAKAGSFYGRLGMTDVLDLQDYLREIYDGAWGPAYTGDILDPPAGRFSLAQCTRLQQGLTSGRFFVTMVRIVNSN